MHSAVRIADVKTIAELNMIKSLMQDDPEWQRSAGELHFNCVVAVCYVCHRPSVVFHDVYVRLQELHKALNSRGWEMEACGLWACPDCKDTPERNGVV